jgi:phage protein D
MADLPPRQLPPRPTWREALESVYQNMRTAGAKAATLLEQRRYAEDECERLGLKLARKADPEVAGQRYIARETAPDGENQRKAAVALRKIDNEYQRAIGDQKHWEASWKWYADELDAHPELADQRVKVPGE